MKLRVWLFVFALVFVLSNAAAAELQWVDKPTSEIGDRAPSISTYTVSNADVHAEPDSKSKVISQIKSDVDVTVVRVRVLWDPEAKTDYPGKAGETVKESWFKLSKPVEGWIDGRNIGIGPYESGFVDEFLKNLK